ncbi:uncharacterized protein BO80DRAFT_428476 [Aspergillus ibericus CBS 121593]|uniref:Uncharacterized protein n=1 Tax=Aspergillus ibericus CBS 121593 TaxID=1448316 RepID=A0A395GQY5_9EURO|nr:hypothetical protein BO80DRAFT_428476 [Aspergillus ibericus CBS 121593]RAK97137.1 hypothetical protein BO80DRAFT_428476 [Aspergillus ibericus CBS 121593]
MGSYPHLNPGRPASQSARPHHPTPQLSSPAPAPFQVPLFLLCRHTPPGRNLPCMARTMKNGRTVSVPFYDARPGSQQDPTCLSSIRATDGNSIWPIRCFRHRFCSHCGDSVSREEGAAAGHSRQAKKGEPTPAKDPTHEGAGRLLLIWVFPVHPVSCSCTSASFIIVIDLAERRNLTFHGLISPTSRTYPRQ